jgi:DNA-binding transcriptional ArsR family regulator
MSDDRLEPDPKVYELHAEVCKVLAHPARLQILDALRGGPISPRELADMIGVSRANLSQHLAMMRHKGLVRRVRVGRSVAYTVSDPRLFNACSTLRCLIREQLRAGGELAERGFFSALGQGDGPADVAEDQSAAESRETRDE